MNLNRLVEQITPMIAQKLLVTATVFGDAKRIKVAPNAALNNTLFNTSSGEIIVEDDVCFGHNVCLLTGTHNIRKKGRKRIATYPQTGRDIIIHSGVWLASNVTVLGPCEIGENAVIAAGSLVMNNVKPNSLYAGSPAKFIKEIEFDNDQ
jgi:acetyltransferase-like isoleucine patch superfamily enzyme